MSKSEDGQRVQLNVTVKQQTVEILREVFPAALDDSERVRRAIAESIERNDATEYSIRKDTS